MPPRLSSMSHKARMKYIEKLRNELGTGQKRRSPVPFPDLSCETTDCRLPAPLSNALSSVKYGRHNKPLPADAEVFPTGNSHKQGLQLITKGAIKNGELQHLSGKKS